MRKVGLTAVYQKPFFAFDGMKPMDVYQQGFEPERGYPF